MKRLEELGISPAPWSADLSIEDDAWVEDRKGNDILRLSRCERKNARLIAAAPELYECLRESVIEMCHYCPSCGGHPDYACRAEDGKCFVKCWRATLAEAAGESEAKE